MLPPTWANLQSLAEFPDVPTALALERTVIAVAPKVVVHDDGRVEFQVR